MKLHTDRLRRRLAWALLLLACFLFPEGEGRGVSPEHLYMIRPFMGMEAKDAEWYAQLLAGEAQPELTNRELRVVTNDSEIMNCSRVANCEIVLLREGREQNGVNHTIMFKAMNKPCGRVEETHECYSDVEKCRGWARRKFKNFIVNHDKTHHRGAR